MTSLLTYPSYDPNNLLDVVMDMLGLKNNAALSKALGVTPTTISGLRNGRLEIGATLLIRLHDATGLSIAHQRILMGDRREHFPHRPSGAAERCAALSEHLQRTAHAEPAAMPHPTTAAADRPDEAECDLGHLFDAVIDILGLNSDAALAKALDVGSPVICNLRNGRTKIGPAMLIRLHDVSGLSIGDLRALMGGQRAILAVPSPHAYACVVGAH